MEHNETWPGAARPGLGLRGERPGMHRVPKGQRSGGGEEPKDEQGTGRV